MLRERVALLFGLVFLVAALAYRCGSVDLANLDPADFSSLGNSGSTTDCSNVSSAFAANVVPIFSDHRCAATGCHGNGSTAGGLSLSGAISTIYSNVTSNRVNTGDPKKSLILRKALGLDNHGGGKLFSSVDDSAYVTIFCWISAGAQNN